MNRAYAESLLVGIDLPASKRELIAYARAQSDGTAVVDALLRIPDRVYAALQDVGEQLEPRQPPQAPARAKVPRAASGRPPGGGSYLGERVEPTNVVAAREST